MNRPPASMRRGRSRVISRRGAAGQHAARAGGGTRPPAARDPGLRWRRGRPSYYGVEWPFWLLMLSPWLVWGAIVLLDHLGVCLICLPR